VNLVLSAYLVIGTLLEERKLMLEFGKEYRDYQGRVSMFLPIKWLNPRQRKSRRNRVHLFVALIVLILTSASVRLHPAQAETLCTLLVDDQTGRVVASQGDCASRTTPASSFKLALALMGYDAGILKDAHTPAWPFRPEYIASHSEWKQTTDPTSWLANSVVWYSQVLTTRLGMERFRAYVEKFDYGNKDVSGNLGKNDGLTEAWLSSSLQISPAEEVGFVRKMLVGNLPVSKNAVSSTMMIVPAWTLADGLVVHGKTGTGIPRAVDGSLDSARGVGWFVGWAEQGGKRFVFARLIRQDSLGGAGFVARDTLKADLPILLANEH
jgi:beta-lactamase class D